MATLFTDKSWGSSPTNKISVSYTYSRSGNDMKYTFTLKVAACNGSSYFGYPIYADIILDGSTVGSGITVKSASPSQWSSAISKTTSTYTVSGKTSGSVSCSIRVYSDLGSDRNTTYGSYDLVVTPYRSSISASNTTIGNVCTITINKAKTSYVHDLKYKFAGGSEWITIVAKTTATSYGWTIPVNEAYAAMGNNQSVTCQLACNTFVQASDTDHIGSSYTISITVSASASANAPTVSLTVTPDSTTQSLTGVSNKVIKYISNVSVSVSATAKNGASISSYKVTCADGKYIDASSGTISGVQSGSFTAMVTDSRGYSNNVEKNLTLVSYVNLTATCSSLTFNPSTGVASITAKGNFFNGSFGSSTNSITVKYRYKIQGGSYGSWTSFASGNIVKSGNTYTATATATLDYTKTYVVQIMASDLANTAGVLSAEKVISSKPTFDWDADDFKFNVDMQIKNGEHIILGDAAGGQSNLYGLDWSGNQIKLIGMGGSSNNNLWIGTNASDGVHPSGNTYISAGDGGHIYAVISNSYKELLSTARFKSGTISITPSAANTPTGKAVSFSTAFSSTPVITTTPYATAVPGTYVTGTSSAGADANGFTAYITRTNTTNSVVAWIATDIGNN